MRVSLLLFKRSDPSPTKPSAPIVAECDPVVLVGFPDYSSVGNSAIWLGVARDGRGRGPKRSCQVSAPARDAPVHIGRDHRHAHILSALLGLPHVLLDNSSGKVRAYYETWSQNLPRVRWAPNPAEAFTMADALTEQAR